MRMPGFTADMALEKKEANYRTLRTGIQTSAPVEPAFWTCRGNFCCDEWGDCIYKGHVHI
jgi:hypothetical protein